ncbi:hypothetical protein QBC42DRAFT_66092 [Cladorrhinum samala]|uniref:Uncharacterized protein n=1 Tax=Cladorrhinum samala TaxID=585594 RepID=A0AAV9HWH7_9PEZI|nr:hypothetical protein QBC42DRAFT_66092 [Cladorrhinum samala]
MARREADRGREREREGRDKERKIWRKIPNWNDGKEEGRIAFVFLCFFFWGGRVVGLVDPGCLLYLFLHLPKTAQYLFYLVLHYLPTPIEYPNFFYQRVCFHLFCLFVLLHHVGRLFAYTHKRGEDAGGDLRYMSNGYMVITKLG